MKLNNNQKRDMTIGRQNTRNVAAQLVPESVTDEDERLKLFRKYRDEIWSDYKDWYWKKLSNNSD
ncbi:MAG: hypothetical protein ACOC5T_05790 [Elusimicrobiota bacterium]